MVNLPAVTAALLRALAERGVRIVEGVTTRLAARRGSEIRVVTDLGEWTSRSLVVTAGHGTNDVLARLNGAILQVPLTRDRPIEAKYFTPPVVAREQFVSDAMPVIAYLDAGIYCHPIVDGLVDKVKIGYYHPPDLPRATTAIDSVMSFVEHCVPSLLDARIEPVDDVDGCDYDLVADDEFVLGAVPAFPVPMSASDGEARATNLPRGSAACWPSSRSSRAPSTTSAASTQPDSRKEAPMPDRPSARTLAATPR